MKFIIPFLGKTREQYLAAGITDYSKRLRRYYPVDVPVLKERHSRKDADEVIKRQHAGVLQESIPQGAYVVALDPEGTMFSSEALAEQIQGWQDRGIQSCCFLIGGHLGLHADLLAKADLRLSFSPMTFTHEMSRLLLLEQLYRAASILAGHNYHK